MESIVPSLFVLIPVLLILLFVIFFIIWMVVGLTGKAFYEVYQRREKIKRFFVYVFKEAVLVLFTVGLTALVYHSHYKHKFVLSPEASSKYVDAIKGLVIICLLGLSYLVYKFASYIVRSVFYGRKSISSMEQYTFAAWVILSGCLIIFILGVSFTEKIECYSREDYGRTLCLFCIRGVTGVFEGVFGFWFVKLFLATLIVIFAYRLIKNLI